MRIQSPPFAPQIHEAALVCSETLPDPAEPLGPAGAYREVADAGASPPDAADASPPGAAGRLLPSPLRNPDEATQPPAAASPSWSLPTNECIALFGAAGFLVGSKFGGAANGAALGQLVGYLVCP